MESNTVQYYEDRQTGSSYCLSTQGKNNIIQNNDFSNAPVCALSVKESESVLVKSNMLGNPEQSADVLVVRESKDVQVQDNTVYSKSHSIRVTNSDHIDISYNKLESDTIGNLDLTNVHESKLYQNEMEGKQTPIYLEDSDNNEIYENTVKLTKGSETAVKLFSSSDNVLYSNDISATASSTLLYLAQDSVDNLVYDNTFYNADVYIRTDTDENKFYVGDDDVQRGNYYANIEDLDIVDSDMDGYGDSGTDYPYWQGSSQGKWLGLGEDLGPKMSN
jgi:nitrous oxidase accessory protein NosD